MALAGNASIESRGAGDVVAVAVAASTHIYRHAIVGINVAGYARGATAGTTPDVRAGIARGEADNSSGANGDIDVEVFTEGEFLLTGTGFTQADVGDAVYASADNAITKTDTNNVLLGRIVRFVSSTQVWVKLMPFAADISVVEAAE